jgi:hypothetical protein
VPIAGARTKRNADLPCGGPPSLHASAPDLLVLVNDWAKRIDPQSKALSEKLEKPPPSADSRGFRKSATGSARVGCSRPAREPGELEDCGPSEGCTSWVSPTLTIAPTRRVSVGFDGTQATGGQSFFVEIAGTGCLVAFTSGRRSWLRAIPTASRMCSCADRSVKRWRRRTFKRSLSTPGGLKAWAPCTKPRGAG